MQETDDVFENALADDIVEEEVDSLVLTDRQKYNKIMPFLLKLGNLISVHGTKSFMEYMGEVELAEQRVRRGQNIFPKSAQRSDEVDNIEHEETEEDAEEQSEEEQTVESDVVVSDGNRFRSLKMKERVKTKGRPKGKSKQLTFNKTSHDRKGKEPKTGIKKRKITNPVDDEESGASKHSVVFTKKKTL